MLVAGLQRLRAALRGRSSAWRQHFSASIYGDQCQAGGAAVATNLAQGGAAATQAAAAREERQWHVVAAGRAGQPRVELRLSL